MSPIALVGRFETLRELINVTRKRLGDQEEAIVVSWVAATQRIHTSLMVELNIRCVQIQKLCCCPLIFGHSAKVLRVHISDRLTCLYS